MDDETPSHGAGGLTRRSFLHGGAAAGLAAGLLGTAREIAPAAAEEAGRHEHGVPLLGPGPVPMRFRINGRDYEAALEPRATLLDALRDRFDLTGAKRVCDRGTCGACTVLVGGRAVYACSMLAIAAQAAQVGEIETVESLGSPERMHPLQAAFVHQDAQQCGFCTPGFVVAAKALLDRSPRPSEAEIADGLSGNVCRCGTYAGIRRAVAAVGGGPGSGGSGDG